MGPRGLIPLSPWFTGVPLGQPLLAPALSRWACPLTTLSSSQTSLKHLNSSLRGPTYPTLKMDFYTVSVDPTSFPLLPLFFHQCSPTCLPCFFGHAHLKYNKCALKVEQFPWGVDDSLLSASCRYF